MSGERARPEAFDARMRRILADADTSPGFESRVMRQVAALRTKPTVDLRATMERKRELAYRRLRREAWMNVATAAGIGAAAIALIWRGGPEVTGYVRAALEVGTNPGFLSGVALAVLGIALWPLLQRFLPR